MAGDNAERGSELARFIEESLKELDHQAHRQLTSSRV
jgi:hypothetical protein